MAESRTKRQLVTAGATFAVALSIGFVMQYGDAVAGRWGTDAPVAGPDTRLDPEAVVIPVAANMAVPTALPTPLSIRPQTEASFQSVALSDLEVPAMSVPVVADTVTVAAAEPAGSIDLVNATVASLPVQDSAAMPAAPAVPEADVAEACRAAMTATPTDLAMVRLEVVNPCRPSAVVAIHHQGMMFNAITDAAGGLDITVPALATEAFFILAYDDGEGAVAITGVPSLTLYDRAVLQWQGEDDVQLHALEFGAAYGQDGHVWSESPADPKQAVAGLGGFMTQLGDPAVSDGMMAEVYTFPSGIALEEGQVALSVETEITPRNCGRVVEAQSIQVLPGQESAVVDMSMTLPACDAVGEYLVLKNMFEDLTLVSK